MRCLLLFALALLTGCTSSSFLGDPVEPYQDVLEGAPPELVAFNRPLRRGSFTVVLTDSTRIRNVENIALGMETTRYRIRGKQSTYLPTATVERVVKRKGLGAGRGAVFGAIPGAVIGAAGLVTLLGGGNEDLGDRVAVAEIAGIAGVTVALVGAMLGGVGGSAFPGRERVVYQAPLDRYLAAPER